jgi:hypothetical protein
VICPIVSPRQVANYIRVQHWFNKNTVSASHPLIFIIAAQMYVDAHAISGRRERCHFAPCSSNGGLKYKPVLGVAAGGTLNRLLLKAVYEALLSR